MKEGENECHTSCQVYQRLLAIWERKKSDNSHNVNRAIHLWVCLCLFPKLHAFYSHISFLVLVLSPVLTSGSARRLHRHDDVIQTIPPFFLWRRIMWLAWMIRRQILGKPRDRIFASFIDVHVLVPTWVCANRGARRLHRHDDATQIIVSFSLSEEISAVGRSKTAPDS